MNDLAHGLAVGAAARANALGEGATVGEIGVGVDFEDVDVAGGGVEAHVDAGVVAAVDGAEGAHRDVLDVRGGLGGQVVRGALAFDGVVVAAVGVPLGAVGDDGGERAGWGGGGPWSSAPPLSCSS